MRKFIQSNVIVLSFSRFFFIVALHVLKHWMYRARKHEHSFLSSSEIALRTDIINNLQIVNEINHLLQRIDLRHDVNVCNVRKFQRHKRMHTY